MIPKIQRLKRLEEVIAFTDEGKVVIEGNDNPTDIQIGQALRKYARQFAVARTMSNNSEFRLTRPHPKISAPKGTTKTKSQWMKELGIDEKAFDGIKASGCLMQLR